MYRDTYQFWLFDYECDVKCINTGGGRKENNPKLVKFPSDLESVKTLGSWTSSRPSVTLTVDDVPLVP